MHFNADTTVLIIDDAVTVREGLRSMLGMAGITRAESAATASEARVRLKARNYDVVLCDYNLGEGMDGQELLEAMRREGLLPFRCIWIMITGERKYERVVAAAEMAPDDYILKPFTSHILMERLVGAGARKVFLAPAYRLLEAGKVAEAIVVLAELAGKEGAPQEHRIDAQRLRAELLVSSGRQHEALEIYLALLSQRIIPWARMGVARIYSEQGQLDQANELLREIIDESPMYTDAYDLLAKNLGSDGQYRDALAVLEKAVAISPRNAQRLHSCGMSALRAGNAHKSAEYLQKAIDIGRHNNADGAELLVDLLLAYSAAGAAQGVDKLQAELAALLGPDPCGRFVQQVCRALAALARGNHEEAFGLLGAIAGELSAASLSFAAALRFLDAAVRLRPELPGRQLEDWTRQITQRFVQGRLDLNDVLEVVRSHPVCRRVAEETFSSLHNLNHHAAELVGAGKVAEAGAMLFDAAMQSLNVRTGMNACALLLKLYEEQCARGRRDEDGAASLHALLAWLPPDNERVKGFWSRLHACTGE